MQIEHYGYEFHFPTQGSPLPLSDWEIVGMAAWLWARSKLHRPWNIAMFEQEVMDSVQLQQFVLTTHRECPVGYLAWGRLSEEAEVKYIANPNSLSLQDKSSGSYLWLLNWVAPQGGTKEFSWFARRILFQQSVAHMLRIKLDNRGIGRLVSARGILVTREDYAKEVVRMLKSFEMGVKSRQKMKSQRDISATLS